MLVAPADTLSVSEVFDLTRFGELTLSEGGILVQPTELARPGTAEAEAIATGNTLRRITLDDGGNDSLTPATAPYLTPTTPVRVGDELTFTEPLVLGYGFGQWRLQPADGTAEGVFAPQNTRPRRPRRGRRRRPGRRLQRPQLLPDAGAARTPAGRGSAAQFEKQADKIVPAINALGADVVTLMEIEDTDSTGYAPGNADAALADLVDRLNADAGAERVGLRPAARRSCTAWTATSSATRSSSSPPRSDPVGDPVGLVDESVWFNAREPHRPDLHRRRRPRTTSSRSWPTTSSPRAPGDPAPVGNDNEDTGGRAPGTATAPGRRRPWRRSPTGCAPRPRTRTSCCWATSTPTPRRTRSSVCATAGFEDLGDLLDAGRYSYVFDDHVGLARPRPVHRALTEKVTDLAHWNINAVESFAYQYAGDPALYAADPFRSSDHDPLVLGLDLEAPEPEPDYPCDGREPTVLGTPARRPARHRRPGRHPRAERRRPRRRASTATTWSAAAPATTVLGGGNGADRLSRPGR